VQLVVGRIGRAHGVHGEVTVEVRTDDPDSRYAPGSTLVTDPAERGPLTVERARPRPGGLIVAFAGVTGREEAEALRDTLLLVESETLPALADPDEYYDHELVGLAAVLPSGASLGTVDDVVHGAGGDLLVVRTHEGREHLVPFVRTIVPTVDVPGGRVVVDPPPGLLELS
jgi:16S rRNA processing protein RimM